MRASTVRTYAAASAVPAMIVVIAHLAYVWQQHPSSADRQTSAFGHGIALAAILAAVLAAGRVAQWLEGASARVLPGVIGVVGTIAVFAHLADDWSAGPAAVRSPRILVEHLALFGLVGLAAWVAGRFEAQSRAGRARHG
jgi:hypothetical protein